MKPDKTKAHALFKCLLEVEMALIERGQAQMNESFQKFNEAADTINNMPKDVFDELKRTKKKTTTNQSSRLITLVDDFVVGRKINYMCHYQVTCIGGLK